MRTWTLLPLLIAVACAAAPEPGEEPTPQEQASREERSPLADLVPPGFGTLHQDDVTLTLRQGPLLLKATPLAESVIRLTAPDTYTRLNALAESRREEAARQSMARDPSLWLVSFFSYEPDVTYQPEVLRFQQQGRLYRPLATLPLGSGWGRQRLSQQEQQSAVYAFDPTIDLTLPLTLLYEQQRTDAWEGIISKLEIEAAKVRSRAGTPGS